MRAQQACMCQPWSLMEVRLRCWVISAAVMDPLTSCLLAKIRTPDFFKSYGENGMFQKKNEENIIQYM